MKEKDVKKLKTYLELWDINFEELCDLIYAREKYIRDKLLEE